MPTPHFLKGHTLEYWRERYEYWYSENIGPVDNVTNDRMNRSRFDWNDIVAIVFDRDTPHEIADGSYYWQTTESMVLLDGRFAIQIRKEPNASILDIQNRWDALARVYEDSFGIEYPNCPECGEPIDYCQGGHEFGFLEGEE